jgi:hypothetical protein
MNRENQQLVANEPVEFEKFRFLALHISYLYISHSNEIYS